MSRATLYVVATPLGNLGDLSPRAVEVLRRVALVAAEDTRRARVLLRHAGANPPVVSFHAHSPPKRLETLLDALGEGRDVALVSDAGTPTVSDPGADLVRAARKAGAAVVAVPGPSAVAAALSISGLPADRYTFLGFAPRKGAARRRLLETAAASPWTVVLFEAAPRLAELLADLEAVCGSGRDAAVARELTKVYEELNSGTLHELEVYYREHPPRGEVTVLVSGSASTARRADPDAARARAATLLAAGLTRKDVSARLVTEFDLPRNEAYKLVTEL